MSYTFSAKNYSNGKNGSLYKAIEDHLQNDNSSYVCVELGEDVVSSNGSFENFSTHFEDRVNA